MAQYLQPCEVIDWQVPQVLMQAQRLAQGAATDVEVARCCFEFVRDEIQHSGDFQRDDPVYRASDVLAAGAGWCYAKSHLLAALLRANNIPAGLCCQRLTIDGEQGFYCLHGLNAAWLPQYGWYRMDARGNNRNVNAVFAPPVERLAFPIQHEGEADLPGIFPQPLPVVVNVLSTYKGYQQVLDHLPDIALW